MNDIDLNGLAEDLKQLVYVSNLPDLHSEYGKDHLILMLDFVQNENMPSPKENRWVGYVQACLVMAEACTLEEMKKVTIKHKYNNDKD